MSYSCSDLADDVTNHLIELGLIRSKDVPDDGPSEQAQLIKVAISAAVANSEGKAAATDFFSELLRSVETLGSICDELGVSAFVHLMYLHSAILNGMSIELYPNEAKRLGLVHALPSGERWWKFVSEVPETK